MKKTLLIGLFLNLYCCQKPDDKCGQVIQKTMINNKYYFVLQTEEYVHYYSNPSNPTIPDDGVRQGAVTKEVYDSFTVGDTYCSE